MFYRVLNTLLCPSIHYNEIKITQPAIICAKQTTKTLEEGVKTCSNITKTPEQQQWRHCGVFIVNFEHIFYHIIVFPMLPLSRWMLAGKQVVGYNLPNRFLRIPALNKLFRNQKLGKSCPPVSLLVRKVFVEKRQRNKRVGFSFDGPLRVI